jgi:hypothetical protein
MSLASISHFSRERDPRISRPARAKLSRVSRGQLRATPVRRAGFQHPRPTTHHLRSRAFPASSDRACLTPACSGLAALAADARR